MAASTRKVLRTYLYPYSWHIMAIATLQFLAVITQVLAIGMLKPILDTGVEGYGVEYIVAQGVVLLGITMTFALAVSLASKMSSEVASYVASDLRRDVLAASLRVQSLESAGSTTTYSLSSLTSNVMVVQDYIYKSFAVYMPLPPLAILMVLCTYYISSTVGLMVAVAMIAVIALTFILSMRISKVHGESMEGQDIIYGLLREKVNGARTIKSYGGEDYEVKKFWGFSGFYGNRNFKIAMNSYHLPSFTTAFIWIFIVFVYMVAALGMSEQTIRPSHLMLFMQFTTCIISCLAIVPYICLHVPYALANMERVEEIVNATDDRPRTTVRKEGADALVAENVSFVDQFGRRMLDNLNLVVKTGEITTVTGPNGSGITELIDMVTAFSVPASGKIEVCGMDVGTSNPSDIRSAVSYAGRQSGTFSTTMRFNLDPFGTHDEKEILDVCKKTGFISYVNSLRDGLDTKVSPKAMSGGQSQLLALTRCLLRDAELYVFDDCFFSMDLVTRKKALSAVLDICSGKTVLFASHDMSTVELSQKVFVVKDGHVVDSGTHSGLLKESSFYSDMFKKSSGGLSC